METPKLLPCPHCGSPDIAFSVLKISIGLTVHYAAKIFCTGCWAIMPGSDAYSENDAIEKAVKSWNRRCGKEGNQNGKE